MAWRTTITLLTTCFLLGTTFTHWIADHNVLWRSPLTPAALEQSIRYYTLIGSGPPLLGWVYVGLVGLAIAAATAKLVSGWRGRSGEVLFDGASLLLILSITYNQATEVFPTLRAFPSPLPTNLVDHELFPTLATRVRDLANDNIITAVMLTGIMTLQAGRVYSRNDGADADGHDADELRSEPASADTSAASTRASTPKPLSERNATPFRELTEEEALELKRASSNEDVTRQSAGVGVRTRSSTKR